MSNTALKGSESFAVETASGGLAGEDYAEVQWTSELSAECQAADAIFLVVVAAQSGGDDVQAKETRVSLAVLMPGDELNPVFEQESYQGTVDGDGNVDVDTIVAVDGDAYIGAAITLDIDPESGDQISFSLFA